MLLYGFQLSLLLPACSLQFQVLSITQGALGCIPPAPLLSDAEILNYLHVPEHNVLYPTFVPLNEPVLPHSGMYHQLVRTQL